MDKTPSHVCFLREILDIFPKAKIIIIHRHPVDVAASLLSAGKSWGKNWAPRNVIEAARMWKRYTRCGLSNNKYVPADQLFETSFEQVKNNGKEILKRIFAFLNLEGNGRDFQNYLKANRPGSPDMTKIPLYGEFAGQHIVEPEGFYKKKESDGHLSVVAKMIINLLCLKEMWALGYNIK